MKNWIVITSFTYPHEAHLAKMKLESEGIETKIIDELTAQVNNFYSNAIGGVKLMVKESDLEKAIEILHKSRIIIKEKGKKAVSEKKIRSQLLTAKLIYYVSAIILIISFGVIVYSLITMPTTREKLTREKWCFNSLYYDDYEFFPHTIDSTKSIQDISITIPNECPEFISFLDSGIVFLPGFNSERLKANWKLDGKELTIWPTNNDIELISKSKDKVISGEDPTENIYYGKYNVDFDNIILILENERGVIYATR